MAKSVKSDVEIVQDDVEVLADASEAPEGDFEPSTSIVPLLPSDPTEMVFELSPAEIKRLRNEIVSYGTDPLTARICQSVIDFLPVEQWDGVPANLARLDQLKKSAKLPSWWNQFVTIMLETDGLRSLNSAARELNISRFIISAFCHSNGLQTILHTLKLANQETATDALEGELFRRAMNESDKGSIPLLIFALKGNRQHKYKEGQTIAVQVNNALPTSWTIEPQVRTDR